MPSQQPHPDFTVIKFTVDIDGFDEDVTVQVEGNDNIMLTIPEGTKYTTTIHFKANKKLEKFSYTQNAIKAGITVKKTDKYLGDVFEPREEPYQVKFEPDETPSGFFFRGKCGVRSDYKLNGEIVYAVDWVCDVTKKK